MRRIASLIVLAAVLAAPAAAQARPHVTSAYLWRTHGQLHLNFRTDRALPEKINFPQTPITPSGTTYTVSDSLHCYQVDARVVKDVVVGTEQRARPGDRVRVKIGTFYNRRLEVLARNRYYQRGGPIGCTSDPKANRVIFGLFPSPEVEPVRIFFTANAGPYLAGLRWTGWGTSRATATGVYISNCASCGPKIRKRTTVVLNKTFRCLPFGVQTRAYTGYATIFDSNGDPVRQTVGGGAFC